jgi:hypothetical protein
MFASYVVYCGNRQARRLHGGLAEAADDYVRSVRPVAPRLAEPATPRRYAAPRVNVDAFRATTPAHQTLAQYR